MFGATLPPEASQRMAAALSGRDGDAVAEARDQRDAAFRLAEEATEQNTRLAAENIDLCGQLRDARIKISELELENERLKAGEF